VVGGGEPRRLTALVGRGPKPTVFAHAWAQTDLTIGHLVGEGGEADPLGDMCMMESADCRVGFRPTHRGGVPVAREASVGVDVLSLREGGEADPLGDMCPLGREGDLDVMDVLDREGDPDVTDVHRHGGGPVPRLVAHWLGSCEVSDPSWFHSSSADSSGPKGPMWAFFQQKLLHIVSFPEDAGAFVPAQGCERCLHGLTLVDPLEISVEVSTKQVGTVAHGCSDWRPDEEVVPVLLPSGDRAHVLLLQRPAPGRFGRQWTGVTTLGFWRGRWRIRGSGTRRRRGRTTATIVPRRRRRGTRHRGLAAGRPRTPLRADSWLG
jgi:hypothetical protein